MSLAVEFLVHGLAFLLPRVANLAEHELVPVHACERRPWEVHSHDCCAVCNLCVGDDFLALKECMCDTFTPAPPVVLDRVLSVSGAPRTRRTTVEGSTAGSALICNTDVE